MASVPDYAVAPPPDPAGEEPHDESRQWPRWPLWTPFAALGAGLAFALVVSGIVIAIFQAAGVHANEDSPGLAFGTTLAIDLSIVGASIYILRLVAQPRPRDFGIRRSRLGYSVGIIAIALFAFFVFEIAYGKLFDPKNPQKIVDQLGADRGTALLVAGALLVIVLVPLCEEFFFRAFVFRVLRARMGFWLAAALDGVIFGAAHTSLVLLPVLAVLGVALCWVYERTGTLFAPVAIHALNNTLAYAASSDGWLASGIVGAAMLTALVLVPGKLLPISDPGYKMRARTSP